jgi:hypothetical protein
MKQYTEFGRVFVDVFIYTFQINEQNEHFYLTFYIIHLHKACVFVDTFYENGLLQPTFYTVNPSNYFIMRKALLRAEVVLTQLVDSCRWA